MSIIATITCKTFEAHLAIFAETKDVVAAAFAKGELHCTPDAHVGQTSFQAAKLCFHPVNGSSDIFNFPASEKAECLSFKEVAEYPDEFEDYGSFSEKLYTECPGCGQHIAVSDLYKVNGTCDKCRDGEVCFSCLQKPCMACNEEV